MTFGIKDYLIAGLVLALALLGVAYRSQGNDLDEAHTQIGAAEQGKRNSDEIAQQCSRSITAMQEEQSKREAQSKPVIAESKTYNTSQGAKAQTIMSTPASVPGNDYQSAKDRAARWLKEQTK